MVPTSPPPPQKVSTLPCRQAESSGASFSAIPPGVTSYIGGKRSIAESGTQNPVSLIPSGSKIRVAKNRSSAIPDTTSTIRPTTSLPTLYCQRVPGSHSIGSSAIRRTIRSSPP